MSAETKRLVKKIVKAFGPDLMSITVSEDCIEVYHFNYCGDLMRSIYSNGIETTEPVSDLQIRSR